VPPITREEFQKGRRKLPLESTILQYLTANSGHAFTAQEIGRAVGLFKGINLIEDALATGQLNSALRGLLADRTVSAKTVSGRLYYAAA